MPLGKYVSWLWEASRSVRLQEGGREEQGGGYNRAEGHWHYTSIIFMIALP